MAAAQADPVAEALEAEAVLVAAYAAGDLSAARTLSERLVPRVLGLARRMLGDAAEAEDIAQEAMLRLWRAAPGWRSGEARVSTWVTRVAINLCTDRLRRRRIVDLETAFGPEDAGNAVPDPGPSAETGLRRAERAIALRRALADLPERQAQAVALRHLEGYSNPEIAEVMDIGVEAVESLTARGKRALAARLSDQRPALGWSDDDDEAI